MERSDASLENFHGTVRVFISVSHLAALIPISSYLRGDHRTQQVLMNQLLSFSRGETFPRVTVLKLYMVKDIITGFIRVMKNLKKLKNRSLL